MKSKQTQNQKKKKVVHRINITVLYWKAFERAFEKYVMECVLTKLSFHFYFSLSSHQMMIYFQFQNNINDVLNCRN